MTSNFEGAEAEAGEATMSDETSGASGGKEVIAGTEESYASTQPPRSAGQTALGCLGVVGGMLSYWAVLFLVSDYVIEDTTGGAAMLLGIGPFALLAFATAVILAMLRVGFLWMCAGGAVAALASLVLMKINYGL